MRRALPFVLVFLATCKSSRDRPPVLSADAEEDLPSPSQAPPPTDAPAPGSPFYVPDPEGRPTAIQRSDAPNIRYASLDASTCEAELGHRGVLFARAAPMSDVMAPLRLRGPLHGVSIHSGLPPAERERATMEIFDCRRTRTTSISRSRPTRRGR